MLIDTASHILPRWHGLSADERDCRLSLVLEGSPLIRVRLERCRLA